MVTLRIEGSMVFGPFDENTAIDGDAFTPNCVLTLVM